MGDLPNLPPGWSWEATDGIIKSASTDEDYAQVAGETLAEVVNRANTFHDWYLRAAITDAATAAGVVLPEGWNAEALLEAAVEGVGFRWVRFAPSCLRLVHGRRGLGRVLSAGATSWAVTPGGEIVGEGRRYSEESAALDLWEAVGPEGLPMPPLPEVDP